jgi:hypothetical protein
MKNKYPTVQSLRQNQWKVAVIHKNKNVAPKAYTHIIVTTPDKKHAEGFAYVHDEDNFDRKIGVRVALGRALKNLANNIFIPSFPRYEQ